MDTATHVIYADVHTLPLPDALPICSARQRRRGGGLHLCRNARLRRGRRTGAGREDAEHGADLDRRALFRRDRLQRARGRRVDLQGHLVGLQLKQRLVGSGGLAGPLQPLGDRRLGHRFAERRHGDVDRLAVAARDGLRIRLRGFGARGGLLPRLVGVRRRLCLLRIWLLRLWLLGLRLLRRCAGTVADAPEQGAHLDIGARSEEHTSELQSLMRISYAVFHLLLHVRTHLYPPRASSALRAVVSVVSPVVPAPGLASGCAGSAPAAGCACGLSVSVVASAFSGSGFSGAGFLGSGFFAGAPAPSPMRPSRAPTSTLAPAAAITSNSTPATEALTSKVTLSVSSSTIGSSTATASPGCFSHWATVASVTDSPRAGTTISVAISTLTLLRHCVRKPSAKALLLGAGYSAACPLLAVLWRASACVRRDWMRPIGFLPSVRASSSNFACSSRWRLCDPVAGEAAEYRPA